MNLLFFDIAIKSGIIFLTIGPCDDWYSCVDGFVQLVLVLLNRCCNSDCWWWIGWFNGLSGKWTENPFASGALIWFVGEKSKSRQLDRRIQVLMFDIFCWESWNSAQNTKNLRRTPGKLKKPSSQLAPSGFPRKTRGTCKIQVGLDLSKLIPSGFPRKTRGNLQNPS